MYTTTQRDGIGYNLAYIGSDSPKLPEPFDQGYMRALFDYGYQRASRGYDPGAEATVLAAGLGSKLKLTLHETCAGRAVVCP